MGLLSSFRNHTLFTFDAHTYCPCVVASLRKKIKYYVNNQIYHPILKSKRVYNIFSYTQLFRVKNFSSICLYCIISSKVIQLFNPDRHTDRQTDRHTNPHPYTGGRNFFMPVFDTFHFTTFASLTPFVKDK